MYVSKNEDNITKALMDGYQLQIDIFLLDRY